MGKMMNTGRVLGNKGVTLSRTTQFAIYGALLGLGSFNGSVQITSTVPIITLAIIPKPRGRFVP